MLEDGIAAFNVRLSMPPPSELSVSTRLPSARSDLSLVSGSTLQFGPSDWSTPKAVTIASRRDDDTVDEVVELSVASLELPIERVRVRIIDEIAAVEPPEGGAGGEPGGGASGAGGDDDTGGTGDGGNGGSAGESDGGAGPGSGGTATGGGGSGAEGGEPGASGEGTGGEVSANDESSEGCGCALGSRSGNGAAAVLAALALLRRLRRRNEMGSSALPRARLKTPAHAR
jgi:MYXO-CTERM domain-containing protein